MSRRSVGVFLMTILMVVLSAPAQVQFLDETFEFSAERPAIGTWVGNVTLPQAPEKTMFAAFTIESGDDGLLLKAMTFLAAGAMNKDVGLVEVDESRLGFSLKGTGGEYRFEGEIHEDGQRYVGTVSLRAPDQPAGEAVGFEFARTPRPLDLPESQAYTGDLSIQTVNLGMTIVLAPTPGGNWVGHIDVRMQFVNAFPVVNLSETDGVITGELPVPGGASFEVSMTARQQRLIGVFKQAGMTMDIDFGRDANYAYREIKRPQEPKAPFPYLTRDIELQHPDGFAISGTLTIPDSTTFGDGPFPVAIMISGSGQQNRDEALLGHKPFLVIADYLTRQGIAVMRYDDRGIGGTGGLDSLETATSRDFATDTLAVVDHLKTIEEIDADRIGLIGHSEGGLIAPMVGTMTDDIAFMVLMAGPGVPGRELLAVQRKLLTMASGATEAMAERQNADVEQLIDRLLEGADTDELVEAALVLARAQTQGLEISDAELESKVRGQINMLASAWMRFFLTYDPAGALRSVQCPVLAINGTKDLQVWHEQNLDMIERIMLEAGGNISIKRYEGLNHLFQPADTGSIAEYSRIEITFDEAVMRDMVDWIKENVR